MKGNYTLSCKSLTTATIVFILFTGSCYADLNQQNLDKDTYDEDIFLTLNDAQKIVESDSSLAAFKQDYIHVFNELGWQKDLPSLTQLRKYKRWNSNSDGTLRKYNSWKEMQTIRWIENEGNVYLEQGISIKLSDGIQITQWNKLPKNEKYSSLKQHNKGAKLYYLRSVNNGFTQWEGYLAIKKITPFKGEDLNIGSDKEILKEYIKTQTKLYLIDYQQTFAGLRIEDNVWLRPPVINEARNGMHWVLSRPTLKDLVEDRVVTIKFAKWGHESIAVMRVSIPHSYHSANAQYLIYEPEIKKLFENISFENTYIHNKIAEENKGNSRLQHLITGIPYSPSPLSYYEPQPTPKPSLFWWFRIISGVLILGFILIIWAINHTDKQGNSWKKIVLGTFVLAIFSVIYMFVLLFN